MKNTGQIILKTLLPVLIGGAVVVLMMSRDFDIDTWLSIDWNIYTIGCIALALLLPLAGKLDLPGDSECSATSI